jgi:hypothetical protein
VSRKEAEAFRIFRKEHCAQIAVAETYLSVLCNGAGDAERLQADTDSRSRVGSFLAALFDSDSRADCVCPNRIFKADRLCASYDLIAIDTFGKADVFAFFHGRNAVFFQHAVDFVYSSFVTFK